MTARAWFRTAYGLWLFGIIAYFVPPATWSPVSRFATVHEIVEHGTPSIDAMADATGDRSLVGRHWYSDKAPIPTLAALPAYALFRIADRARGTAPSYSALAAGELPAVHVDVNRSFQRALYACSFSTAGVSGAVLGVLLFELLSRRFSRIASLIGSSVTVLGSPLFPYATSFYGHSIAALFLTGAIAALCFEPDAPPSAHSLRIAGACLTLAVGSEYISAGPGLCALVVVILGWCWPRPDGSAALGARAVLRALLELGLGALLPALVIAAWHTRCFGAPWRTGYSFIARPEFAAGHASGLLGVHLPDPRVLVELLVGRRRGLLYVAPVALVGLVGGAAYAWSRRDLAARAGLAALLTLWLLNGGYYMWWGGASAGPRHLVPVLGLCAFGVAAAWQVAKLRWLVIVLACVSIANMLIFAGVGVEAPERGDVLLGYAYPRFLQGKLASMSGASNLGIELGLPRAATLGPVVAWILVGYRYLIRQLDDLDADAATKPTGAKH